MAPYRRGDVVWHPAPFRDGGRPYVVLSDDDHPFYGEEYIVVGVTTTERERAVALTPDTDCCDYVQRWCHTPGSSAAVNTDTAGRSGTDSQQSV
jgi:hypothetical protein